MEHVTSTGAFAVTEKECVKMAEFYLIVENLSDSLKLGDWTPAPKIERKIPSSAPASHKSQKCCFQVAFSLAQENGQSSERSD